MRNLFKYSVEEYTYDTEEEREQHIKEMEFKGWSNDGRVRRSDDGSLMSNRKYYWFAHFYKYN